jgi:hypothetical protein
MSNDGSAEETDDPLYADRRDVSKDGSQLFDRRANVTVVREHRFVGAERVCDVGSTG